MARLRFCCACACSRNHPPGSASWEDWPRPAPLVLGASNRGTQSTLSPSPTSSLPSSLLGISPRPPPSYPSTSSSPTHPPSSPALSAPTSSAHPPPPYHGPPAYGQPPQLYIPPPNIASSSRSPRDPHDPSRHSAPTVFSHASTTSSLVLTLAFTPPPTPTLTPTTPTLSTLLSSFLAISCPNPGHPIDPLFPFPPPSPSTTAPHHAALTQPSARLLRPPNIPTFIDHDASIHESPGSQAWIRHECGTTRPASALEEQRWWGCGEHVGLVGQKDAAGRRNWGSGGWGVSGGG